MRLVARICKVKALRVGSTKLFLRLRVQKPKAQRQSTPDDQDSQVRLCSFCARARQNLGVCLQRDHTRIFYIRKRSSMFLMRLEQEELATDVCAVDRLKSGDKYKELPSMHKAFRQMKR